MHGDTAPDTIGGLWREAPPTETPEAKTPEAKTPEAKTPEAPLLARLLRRVRGAKPLACPW